jgi:hypothetical protein
MRTCQKINSGRGWTSDVAVAVDLEAVERRRHLGRVRVVEVGPAGDGVAADVGVRHARRLRRAPHPTLLLVEPEPCTHRPRAVHVVPELRRQKPLQNLRVRRARFRRKSVRVWPWCKYLHRAGGSDGVDETELVEDVGAAHHRDHHLDVVRAERRLDTSPLAKMTFTGWLN